MHCAHRRYTLVGGRHISSSASDSTNTRTWFSCVLWVPLRLYRPSRATVLNFQPDHSVLHIRCSKRDSHSPWYDDEDEDNQRRLCPDNLTC
jgi:hypothetical protein